MLKPRSTGNVLDRRHGPLPLLAVPSASRLFTPNLMSCLSRVFDFRHGKYLRDTHKPEAILLSLTPLVFERFLPSLTLWLSPNCPWMQANSPIDLTANFLVASFLQLPETSAFGCWNCKQQL